MEFELTSPGVQDECHAKLGGETSACEGGEGRGCYAKEGAIDGDRRKRSESAKLSRQRKNHMEMGSIEHASTLFFDPFFLGQCLALGTMAVAARVVRGALVATNSAAIEVAAKRCGAAVGNVRQDALLLPAQTVSRFERRAVLPHDAREVQTPDPLRVGHDATSAAVGAGRAGLAFVALAFLLRARSERSSRCLRGLEARRRRAHRYLARVDASRSCGEEREA